MSRLEELSRRKGALLACAAKEREELAQICRRFRGAAKFIGFGLRLIDVLKTHPVLVTGLTALLATRRLKKVPLWALIMAKILSSIIPKPKRSS